MQVSEYLQAVTSQMRYKSARSMVEKELRAHIEDQADKYMEFGISKEEAYKKAVEQMGDPIQVGTDMDRLHRPDVDKKAVFLICLLSLGGSILYRWSIDMGDGRMFQISDLFRHLLLDVLPGMFLMFMIIKIDYTRIARYPFLLGLAFVILNTFYSGYWRVGGKYGYIYFSLTVNTILFGAIIHKLRKYKLTGMLFSFLWLIFVVSIHIFYGSVTNPINLLVIGTVLLGVSAFKDWFEAGKKKSIAMFLGLWCVCSILALLGLVFYGFNRASYISYRLMGWLGVHNEGNYIFNVIRTETENAGLFTGSGNLIGVGGNENEYFFINLISRYGYLAALLVAVLLGILFLLLFSGIKKQQNRLGTLMGIAAILTLCIPVAEHIAYNLSLIPAGSLILPFFSGTGPDAWMQGDYCRGAIYSYYAAMGICLSVFRSRNIVTEEDADPRLWLKLKLERQ